MTGDPSIFLHFSSRQSKVFQISFSSVMFSSSCLMRQMRYIIPLAGSGVYPEVSSLLDMPGRCSANFLLRWLKPPQRRTTALLHRFSTLVTAQINNSNALAAVSASLLPQQSNKTHKLPSFAPIFMKNSQRCFSLIPQGKASPMNGEIKHSPGEKYDVIPEEGDTQSTRA